jgi:hypothetical protein
LLLFRPWNHALPALGDSPHSLQNTAQTESDYFIFTRKATETSSSGTSPISRQYRVSPQNMAKKKKKKKNNIFKALLLFLDFPNYP